MSATQKFFRKLWAATGDRAAVPDTTPVDGSVNYETGYGFDYQRAQADPLVKNIERDKLNQVIYDLTLGLQQYQTHGFPEYIQPADNGGVAYSYAKSACVLWTDGQVYQSLVNANTSDPTDTTKWQLAILGTGVGAVQFFPSASAPTGYIKANGALLSRASYPVLWAYAQASGNLAVSDGAWQRGQFSPGDGATTFRIPDLRGYTLRAYDDGAGIDTGRVLGSAQADQVVSHTHTGSADAVGSHAHGGITANSGAHTHTATIPMSNEGGTGTPWGSGGGTAEGNYAWSVDAVGDHAHGINADGAHGHSLTINATGGAENRVKNVALLGCIKYM